VNATLSLWGSDDDNPSLVLPHTHAPAAATTGKEGKKASAGKASAGKGAAGKGGAGKGGGVKREVAELSAAEVAAALEAREMKEREKALPPERVAIFRILVIGDDNTRAPPASDLT
jgi:hypothetical protein